MKRLCVVLLVVALIVSCFTGCNSSKSKEIFDKAKSVVSNYNGLKLSFSLSTAAGSNTVESYKLYCDAIAEESQDASHYNGLVIIGDNRIFNEYYVIGSTVYNRSNTAISSYVLGEPTGYSLKSDFIALLNSLSSLSWKESENKTQVILTHKLTSVDVDSLFNSTKLGNVLEDFAGGNISKIDFVNCSVTVKFIKESNIPVSLAIDLTNAVPDIATQEGVDSVILTVVISELNNLVIPEISGKDDDVTVPVETDDGSVKENENTAPSESAEVVENRDDPATPVSGEPVFEGVPHYSDGHEEEGSGEEIIYEEDPTKSSEPPTEEVTEAPVESSTEPNSMPSADGSYRRHAADKVSGNEFTLNGKYYNGLSITIGQLYQNGWVVLDVVSDEGDVIYPGKTHRLEFAPENNNGLSYATIDLDYVNDTDSEVEVSPKYLSSVYVNVKDPGYDIMLLDAYFTGPKGFVNGMTYNELVEILGNGSLVSSSEGSNEYSWSLEDLTLTVYVSNTLGVYAFKLSR